MDTKTALLNSAERAARTRGFDGFSYADLSHDVGIRKASIHHHFATKAVLSAALMKRYSDDVKDACADIEATHNTGGARLDALVQFYRDALDDGHSLCLCVSLSISRDSLAKDVLSQIGRFRTSMMEWIASVYALGKTDGTIKDVQDPSREAAATLALLEGAQLAARAAEDADMFDVALALLLRRL